MNSVRIDDPDDDASLSPDDGDYTQEKGVELSLPSSRIKAENKAVKIVRGLVFWILFVLASLASIGVYMYIRGAEKDSFHEDFAAVGSRLVESFVGDASLRFWMLRTVATAVTLNIESEQGATSSNSSVPSGIWNDLTRELIFKGHARQVTFAPLLHGDEERRAFEAYAQAQQPEDPLAGACFLCGSVDRRFINPAATFVYPGFGEVKCSDVEGVALKGVIQPENCPQATQLAAQTCQCSEEGEAVVDDGRSAIPIIPSSIFRMEGDETVDEEYGGSLYNPIWDFSFFDIENAPVMYNQLADPVRSETLDILRKATTAVSSRTFLRNNTFDSLYDGFVGHLSHHVFYPVLVAKQLVGVVGISINWDTFLTALLPPKNSEHAQVVVRNTWGQVFTFGFKPKEGKGELEFISFGDVHDTRFSDMVVSSRVYDIEQIISTASPNKSANFTDHCIYTFHIYPTPEYESIFLSSAPYLYAAATVAVFLVTSLAFVIYDLIVAHRQRKVISSAMKTREIVSTLFPQSVQDRLYGSKTRGSGSSFITTSKMMLETFLSDGVASQPFVQSESPREDSKAIADFFPHTTVVFIDIVQFTGWSSERAPEQVFKLLETIYGAFDVIARNLGVFKVETIGDSYVAVCGLPTPREKHAVVMARFAEKCIVRFSQLTKELEIFLGPGTSALKARVGLHSGSCVAGVLRGVNCRFQLFGDTVNTASRMESSGSPMCIHASKETADLLIANGKEDWLYPRDESVAIKGKGFMKTFWIVPSNSTSSAASSVPVEEDEHDCLRAAGKTVEIAAEQEVTAKKLRLVEWNVEVLSNHIRPILVDRANSSQDSPNTDLDSAERSLNNEMKVPMEGVVNILSMPSFKEVKMPTNSAAVSIPEQSAAVSIPEQAMQELRAYVAEIANLYEDVPFHCFMHASHVVMAAAKLMNRIVNPDNVNYDRSQSSNPRNSNIEADIVHDVYMSTYGMSVDPLMQFSVVFAMLVHDVGHVGLSNAELIELGTANATKYSQQSVAEQYSVDLAWNILMHDEYRTLRRCIYSNEKELHRFRELLVTAVLATDIADKQLKQFREARWAAAFTPETDKTVREGLTKVDANRRATIVFEYIIQASDVAHTMQHWTTYQKFNTRLFEERYLAWINGRAAKEPSQGWYGGELWFFDHYIIPLAEKLNECGVFGVSYHEVLGYAKANKQEWERKGQCIVEELLKSCREKYGSEVRKVPLENETEYDDHHPSRLLKEQCSI